MPTRVVVIEEVVKDVRELQNEGEYLSLYEEMKFEADKYGSVVSLSIPRPKDCKEGIGNVYIEYANIDDAKAARRVLSTKRFNGSSVYVTFHPEEMYNSNDFRNTLKDNVLTIEGERPLVVEPNVAGGE